MQCNKKMKDISSRAVTIYRYIGILRYLSEKVQYIGTKCISRYIVVTINRNTRKRRVCFLFSFPLKGQRKVIKTHANKVDWKEI